MSTLHDKEGRGRMKSDPKAVGCKYSETAEHLDPTIPPCQGRETGHLLEERVDNLGSCLIAPMGL